MTMQPKPDAGFTMIEILIAIAVVGILAVIAIPQYQDYVIRSKVSECLNFAGSAKTAIAEAQASQRNIMFSFSPTTYCANVQLAPDGTIVLTTQATGAKEAPVLQMTPWGTGGGKQLRWECQFVAGKARHVPASCRTPGIAVPADKLVDSSDSGGSGGGSGGGGPASDGSGSGAGTGGADAESADDGSSSSGGDSAPGGSDPGDSGSGAAASDSTGGGSSDGAGDDGAAAPPPLPASTAPPAAAVSDIVDSDDAVTGGGSAVVGGGGGTVSGTSGGGSASGGAGGGAVDAGSGGGGSGVGAVVPPVEEPKKEEPKKEEAPVTECPHKLPNGKPHPSRCKDWGK